MVRAGMTPAQGIVAATSRPAEYMGLQNLGTLAPGKQASFIVLDANPLDDITNTRRIAQVYFKGRAARSRRDARPADVGGDRRPGTKTGFGLRASGSGLQAPGFGSGLRAPGFRSEPQRIKKAVGGRARDISLLRPSYR